MIPTIWGKTVRGFQVAIIGWGVGLGLLIWIEFNFFSTLSPAAKLQELQLSQSYRFMGDPMIHLTAPEFVTWNIFGLLPVLLSIWAILAGSRLMRADETDGHMDVLLSAATRQKLFLGKFTGYVSALLLIALGMAIGTIAGQNSAQVTVDVWRAIATGLTISLTAFLFGALALLLSHLWRSAAAAAGISAGLMVLSYALDSLGRVRNDTNLERVSPFYYYWQNRTLLPSFTAHPEAVILLAGISVVCVVLAFVFFLRRDIGEGIVRIQFLSRRPARSELASSAPVAPAVSGDWFARVQKNPSLRAVSLHSLRRHASTIFWWSVGLGGYALFMVLVAQSSEESLKKFYVNSPTLSSLFGGHDIGTNAGYIQSTVFIYLPVLTVFFALLLASAWTTDLGRGRLEILFSVPLSRQRILLERFVAVFLATGLLLVAICVCILLGTSLAHLRMDTGKVIEATMGMWPLELLIASLVFLATGRLRNRAIMVLLSLLICVSFFVNLLNPILKLPQGVLNLSVFYQYGTPLLHTVPWSAYATMIALAACFLLLGLLQFRQTDIDRDA